VFWNDLLDGAIPGSPRLVAAGAAAALRVGSAPGATRRWFRATFGAAPAAPRRPPVPVS
jgi:hypothetical protein